MTQTLTKMYRLMLLFHSLTLLWLTVDEETCKKAGGVEEG